ncbi:MAG: thioredoxin family protein [Mogibacterium sp.]|nr:thioredoxin family protein [Mogibacterium sp.]
MTDFIHADNINDLIKASRICILQFGDESCGPCFALRERIDKWLCTHPVAEGRYIPIREFPEVSAQMGILSVPTVAVYVDGKQVVQECGYFSLDHILDKLDRYIGMME